MSLRQEVTELLQELIRLDTVNPPGNETRAAEVLGRLVQTVFFPELWDVRNALTARSKAEA